MTRRTAISLTILSALLVPLAFAPFGWWPLALLAPLPLLRAVGQGSTRQAFYLGILHGTLSYGLALTWFFHIFGTGAAVLYLILGLFSALFCWSYNRLSRAGHRPYVHALLAAMLWTGVEYTRCELWYLRFPWITPGAAWGPTWLSPVVGVYGTSFLVVLAAVAWHHRRSRPLALALTLVLLALGLWRPPPLDPPAVASLSVGIVQSEDCNLRAYQTLTRQLKDAAPAVIIWPEYALPYDVRQDAHDWATLKQLCADTHALLLLGTKTTIGTGERDWRNTALTVGPQGALGEYYKARPVHFFNDGIAGTTFLPVSTPLGRIGTPICFDCDGTEPLRRLAANGAECYLIPVFDEHTWSAGQHVQHAALFRLRATENGRWLASCASSGVSQIIDPHGNVHASLPPLAEAVLSGTIGKSSDLTFFTRLGWIFPWFCVLGTAAWLLPAIRLRWRELRAARRARQAAAVSSQENN